MKVKKGDFVELDFIGRIKESNQIFDLTDEETAKKEKLHQAGAKYRPITICIGEGDVVEGLDEELVNKEVGKDYTIEISPEKGFGKKDAKLIKIVNTNMFTKQNIHPMPGLQVNIDNMMAIIRTVSGGRTVIDFNHPCAGKHVVYEIKILKKVFDDKEKVESIFRFHLGMDNPELELHEGTLHINSDVNEMFHEQLNEKIKKQVPLVKKIQYKKKEEKKEDKKEEKKE
ncbi:MAG: peptidylprolyl isomerase [Nanoarchaeota archaeon]|nr:peptidylprolyl isomerase [Nanoarchaeota archaeon]MCG2717952.1 peptidylprolyl isomerase [Nanoarchaeota archaeon]